MDGRALGIKRVFYKLFDTACRIFYNLSGCNKIDKMFF
jgi:hypothetical protein